MLMIIKYSTGIYQDCVVGHPFADIDAYVLAFVIQLEDDAQIWCSGNNKIMQSLVIADGHVGYIARELLTEIGSNHVLALAKEEKIESCFIL